MSATSPNGGLPLRWVLIFLVAVMAGLLVGMLTFAQAHGWAAAVLAGLIAAGAVTVGAHQIVATR